VVVYLHISLVSFRTKRIKLLGWRVTKSKFDPDTPPCTNPEHNRCGNLLGVVVVGMGGISPPFVCLFSHTEAGVALLPMCRYRPVHFCSCREEQTERHSS